MCKATNLAMFIIMIIIVLNLNFEITLMSEVIASQNSFYKWLAFIITNLKISVKCEFFRDYKDFS